jgi:hypothetical protein
MPTRDLTEFVELARERDLHLDETSTEVFDRLAFARKALAMLRPAKTRVALGEARAHIVVDIGRAWGADADARWAILRVPPTASRRAIALAVVALAPSAPEPWVVDAILDGAA